MCGIAGGLGLGIRGHLESNLNLLNRRGPDSHGLVHLQNNLTLGATRLAMTDPHPRSNQPMIENSTKNVLVFNGEIYNFQELKRKLIKTGHQFFTESDTEVLLKLLSFYGKESINQLEGMFALGFYDNDENTFTIARDFLGKKPLYYSVSSNHFIFSSQVDIIKKYLKKTTLDESTMSSYLKLGYVLDPRTMYKEIKSVQPGESLVIDLESNLIVSRDSYTPERITHASSESIPNLIKSSIIERTTGHASFAVSMSGGVDSTIIAYEAATLGLNFEAYTMRWENSDKARYNQDSNAAKLICQKLGVKLNVVDMPRINTLEDELTKFIGAIGEPNSNPSGVSMMSLYNRISSDANRLVLTGDGSDELFGGYTRYSTLRKFRTIPRVGSNLISNYLMLNSSKFKRISSFSALSASAINSVSWYYWHQLVDDLYLRKLYPSYKLQKIELLDNKYVNLINDSKNTVASLMSKDLKIWLSMESNTKLDRVSMYHSIEARSPFQAEALIGKALIEMRKYQFRRLDKRVLTDNYPVLKTLPVNQTKLGFLSPLGHWLRNNPQLISDSLQYLSLNFDFNKEQLINLSNSAEKGDYHSFRFMWSLIVLAKWHQNHS
jgi:asparagine synthase (glutamine-hydrolysing)